MRITPASRENAKQFDTVFAITECHPPQCQFLRLLAQSSRFQSACMRGPPGLQVVEYKEHKPTAKAMPISRPVGDVGASGTLS